MIRVTDALLSLRPGVEWSMTDDDISTIIWHTPDVEPVSAADIEAEIQRLEAAATEAQVTAEAARTAAIAHAKSLGFTDAMIAVMYPNLTMGA